MPVDRKDLGSVVPTDFTILDASDIAKKSSNPWEEVLRKKQDIASILDDVSDMATWAS